MVDENPDYDSIENHLRRFASREDQKILIFPDEVLKREVETEIGKRSGLKPRTLPIAPDGSAVLELQRRWIPANPRTLTQDTIALINEIASELQRVGAKTFELAFSNVAGSTNPQNDRIIVGVRYVV